MQRLLNITPPARLTGVQMAGPTERNQGDKAEGEKLAGLVVLYSRGRAGGANPGGTRGAGANGLEAN